MAIFDYDYFRPLLIRNARKELDKVLNALPDQTRDTVINLSDGFSVSCFYNITSGMFI